MTQMPTSGDIQLSQAVTRLGDGGGDLQDYYRKGGFVDDIAGNSGVPLSGDISLQDLYSTYPTPASPSSVVSSLFKLNGIQMSWVNNSQNLDEFVGYEFEWKLNVGGTYAAFAGSPNIDTTTTAFHLSTGGVGGDTVFGRVRAVRTDVSDGNGSWVVDTFVI
jgi:hypothetical protein